MEQKQYVMSYDFGTGSVKATLVGLDGAIAGSAMAAYPLYAPEPLWAEQEPEDYYRGLCETTKRVLHETGVAPSAVLGLAICSQWKGIIPLDKNDAVLCRSMTWLDARASKEALEMDRVLQLNYYKEKLLGFKPSSKLNAAMGRNLLCGSDYWAKLKWFRDNKPELYDKTAVFLECNSYVKWRLTGEKAVDMTNHFTRAFNSGKEGTYALMLKLAKVDPKLFPNIVMPCDMVGKVSERASTECGLLPGTPVFGGCGDIPAITLGSGSSGLGDTHAYFGTSGWLGSVVNCDEGFLMTSPLNKTQDLLCFGFQSIGLSFDWALTQLYTAERAALGDGIYETIERELSSIKPGSDGLMASHWLYGERAPFFTDAARGVYIGLNVNHTRAHMLNAMMESVCYSMRLSLDALREGTKRTVPYINAVGGCCANDRWMQMLANVLGIPVNIPYEPRRAGAIGTAYCALTGLGFCRDLNEANAHIRMEKTFTPDAHAQEAYEKPMEIYRTLYKRLNGLFREMQ